jgi:ABC-type Mn2+/Zn2+ transport system permease subunit
VFFVLLGVTAGVATQAVGALLLLGLLAAPAGAALRLTAQPFRAMWLSAAIALASMWIGLTIAYLAPTVPPSFGIIGTATAIYLGTFAWTGATRRWARASIPSTGQLPVDDPPGFSGAAGQQPVPASGPLGSTP